MPRVKNETEKAEVSSRPKELRSRSVPSNLKSRREIRHDRQPSGNGLFSIPVSDEEVDGGDSKIMSVAVG